ncbi:uncharacterized protein EMH_0044930 [Eimeria mitis]|uniref:Uncharacterized protein n=1 Tax=Eimeria mitis TaxID=44415 RepID=U6JVX2_9EIME|nr:uncharacterized protein EMH_0044930 [Eimeria mitis]CDJ28896.1 hypothetical protein EMH_0044930 [Eimeria mitis]
MEWNEIYYYNRAPQKKLLKTTRSPVCTMVECREILKNALIAGCPFQVLVSHAEPLFRYAAGRMQAGGTEPALNAVIPVVDILYCAAKLFGANSQKESWWPALTHHIEGARNGNSEANSSSSCSSSSNTRSSLSSTSKPHAAAEEYHSLVSAQQQQLDGTGGAATAQREASAKGQETRATGEMAQPYHIQHGHQLTGACVFLPTEEQM